MNDPLIELQAAVETMRGEMEKMKREITGLKKVVSVGDDDEGNQARTVTCDFLMVRQRTGKREYGVIISADETGGIISVMHREGPKGGARPAISLRMNEDGVPEGVIYAKDGTRRVLLLGEEERGTVAVFSEGGAPGAVMRGQSGGGSVAVLQRDGQTRGVLVHTAKDEEDSGRTELMFVDDEQQTRLKLLADAKHELLHLAHPGVPQAVVLAGGKEGGSLQLNAPADGSSISMMAMKPLASVVVKEGLDKDPGSEVRLSAGEGVGCAVGLTDALGGKRAELEVTGSVSMLSLNGEGDEEGVELMHMGGKFSSIKLHAPDGGRLVDLMVTNDLGSVGVRSAQEEGTAVSLMMNEGEPLLLMTEKGQGRVMINTGEDCGMISAYGPRGNEGGMASLCGGERSGAVRVGASDGTTFGMLSATDHGGRLDISNDLGLPRIVLGVYQESAGLHLNHTGSVGVSAVATEIGGVVSVHDEEGNRVASLPETGGRDEDDDD